jgi:hypothetical protein
MYIEYDICIELFDRPCFTIKVLIFLPWRIKLRGASQVVGNTSIAIVSFVVIVCTNTCKQLRRTLAP